MDGVTMDITTSLVDHGDGTGTLTTITDGSTSTETVTGLPIPEPPVPDLATTVEQLQAQIVTLTEGLAAAQSLAQVRNAAKAAQ